MHFILNYSVNIYNVFTSPHTIYAYSNLLSSKWTSSLSKKSDQELLKYIAEAAPEKQADVIDILFNRHNDELCRYIQSKVRISEAAQDITSDVWIEAYKKIGKFKWQGKPIYAWLVGIAKIKCLEYHRESKERNSMLDLDDPKYHEQIAHYVDKILDFDRQTDISTNSTATTFREQADLYLADAIETLKLIDCQIIELRYYRNLNSTEIGTELNMKSNAVRQRLKRAQKAIKKHIERRIK